MLTVIHTLYMSGEITREEAILRLTLSLERAAQTNSTTEFAIDIFDYLLEVAA